MTGLWELTPQWRGPDRTDRSRIGRAAILTAPGTTHFPIGAQLSKRTFYYDDAIDRARRKSIAYCADVERRIDGNGAANFGRYRGH